VKSKNIPKVASLTGERNPHGRAAVSALGKHFLLGIQRTITYAIRKTQVSDRSYLNPATRESKVS